MLDIPKIRAVLEEARRWDMDLAQFACWGHVHRLNPVLPLEDLEAWEDLMQVTLPADYRAYLTQLGNGGAGPAYGLAPLRCPSDKFAQLLRRPCIYSEDQEKIFQDVTRQFVHWYSKDDDWALYLEYFPDTPSWKDEQWRDAHWKEWSDELEKILDERVVFPLLDHGQYQIANEGCSGDIYIILNGSYRGYVHCSTTDCDPEFVYPEPCTFASYLELWPMQTFSEYFMSYVNRTEDICKNLPAEKRRQFQRERAAVQNFYTAAQAQDWSGVIQLLNAIPDPMALSQKSKSFYRCYEKPLLKTLPEHPDVSRFFQNMFRPNDKYHMGHNLVTFRFPDDEPDMYPEPTFEEFVQTFFDS